MANLVEVKVPDIGDFNDIPVIEILVKVGDTVKKEDSLVALESDKATMEVPSPVAGVVKELKVAVGDKVSEGKVVLIVEASESAPAPATTPAPAAPAVSASPTPSAPPPVPASTNTDAPVAAPSSAGIPTNVHASPSIRKLAREFGVDLSIYNWAPAPSPASPPINIFPV